jgi:hypothetical protein
MDLDLKKRKGGILSPYQRRVGVVEWWDGGEKYFNPITDIVIIFIFNLHIID